MLLTVTFGTQYRQVAVLCCQCPASGRTSTAPTGVLRAAADCEWRVYDIITSLDRGDRWKATSADATSNAPPSLIEGPMQPSDSTTTSRGDRSMSNVNTYAIMKSKRDQDRYLATNTPRLPAADTTRTHVSYHKRVAQVSYLTKCSMRRWAEPEVSGWKRCRLGELLTRQTRRCF